MDHELQKQMSQFAYSTGQATGFVHFVLSNERALLEFAARGVKRADLENLHESLKKVAEVFYNDAKPM